MADEAVQPEAQYEDSELTVPESTPAPAEAADKEALPSNEWDAEAEEFIQLPTGGGFDPQSASMVTCAAPTRLIVLAGAIDSGKTTLLASIYEMFQEAPLAGYLFAGSLTLPALERRCHLARIASSRSTPDTERTKVTDDTLLHLRVRAEDCSRPSQDVLFTDLGGERFRLAKDSTDECRRLELLLRADHFVLLIDGAKLASLADRHQAHVSAGSLLRSCLDAEMLGPHSYVDVLFAKWDLVAPELGKHRLKKFLEEVRSQFKERFAGRVARLRFFEVAARPTEPGLLFGHNLDQVVPSWIEDAPCRRYSEAEFAGSSAVLREIDRFRARAAEDE